MNWIVFLKICEDCMDVIDVCLGCGVIEFGGFGYRFIFFEEFLYDIVILIRLEICCCCFVIIVYDCSFGWDECIDLFKVIMC